MTPLSLSGLNQTSFGVLLTGHGAEVTGPHRRTFALTSLTP